MAPISASDMWWRVLLAFLAGFVVGWERESHGRPAGLRTTILACVASAVAMLVSEVLFVQSAASAGTGSWRPDPARLGAGILTGIGFLGAGTIMRHEDFVRGVTTAASLWFVTVLGLAFGSGQFGLGLLGTGIALLTLFGLPPFEKHIQKDAYATLTVVATLAGAGEDDLKKRIEALGLKVKGMKLGYDLERRQKTLVYDVKLKKRERFQLGSQVTTELARSPEVLQVHWN